MWERGLGELRVGESEVMRVMLRWRGSNDSLGRYANERHAMQVKFGFVPTIQREANMLGYLYDDEVKVAWC